MLIVIPIPARRASQGPPTTTGRPPLVGLKMLSDANTKMKTEKSDKLLLVTIKL